MDKWVEKNKDAGELILCPYPNCKRRICNTRRYVSITRKLRYQTLKKPEDVTTPPVVKEITKKNQLSASFKKIVYIRDSKPSSSTTERSGVKRKAESSSPAKPAKLSKDDKCGDKKFINSIVSSCKSNLFANYSIRF